jgi:PhnB protein
MQLHTYLIFDGDCEAAFKFYEDCFGGKIESMRTHAETPAGDVPGAWRDKILHASLIVGDQVLLASDAPPGTYEKPQGFYIHIQTKDSSEAERIFHALTDGGTVKMPIQPTFWARSFGMVVDRFGTPWMVQCERTA